MDLWDIVVKFYAVAVFFLMGCAIGVHFSDMLNLSIAGAILITIISFAIFMLSMYTVDFFKTEAKMKMN